MKNDHSRVKAWEDEVVIPTYLVGPEDQNPPLLMKRRNPIHPGSSIIYPYPIQENILNRREDKAWKVFYLENDYLRLAVLPELGGRLLSVWDKRTDEEAIYHNQVLKYARIGIRGAWVSGGIEWNFPNGHTVTTSSPVDCTVRENDDQSATLLIGDIERVSRMRWTVGITLHREYAYFETEVRLNNRTFLPNRFWFWANSSAPVSGGMEYITTATRVMTLKDLMSFPTNEGVDINWDRNHVEAQDMFCLNPREEFVGWYNHDLERGLVNFADRGEARGTKFYTWGNSDDGAIWEERLTDNDGPYAEMQSGRLPTMGIWEILSPYSVESWKEVWYPVTRIGAPVYANREAAFSLERLKPDSKLRLGVQVTSVQPGAVIRLRVGQETVWEQKRDFDPSEPFTVEIPLKDEKYLSLETTLTLSSSDGDTLARYIRRGEAEAEAEIKGYIKIEPDRKSSRAEDQWLNGVDYEKLGDREKARQAYEKALEDDPGFSPAHLSLGILLLRRGKYSGAAGSFKKALERNRGDEGARFYLGVSLLSGEQFAEAIEEFKALLRSRLYRAGSLYLLGGLYLGQGNIPKAVEQLEKSCAQFSENKNAAALLACALRKKQRLEEAEAWILSVLKDDPLNFLALAEGYFLSLAGGSNAESAARKEQLERILRDEAQSYLELATDYALFGMYREAIEILSLYSPAEPGKPYPLIHYYLGYYLEKVNDEDARRHYRQGGQAEPYFVFPHRLESERVLGRVIDLMPDDGRAGYYLGNLLCAKDRPEEAIELWEAAALKEKSFSVLHRNLGRAYWKVLEDPDRAIKEYELALECDPQDYKLYFELDRLYVACGLEEKRQRLMEKIPPNLLENDVIAERAALFYMDNDDFDRVLEIIRSTYFYPWEVYKGVRLLYVDANIARGIKSMTEEEYELSIESFKEVLKYPRNIGVGEPANKSNAEALYRIGVALEKPGDQNAARDYWQQAAAEERPVWNDLCYYKAKALQRLGRAGEADQILEGLLDFARKRLVESCADQAESLYLSGLGHKGKGDSVKARKDFRAALALDNAHRRCRWELSGFTGD